MKKGLMKKKMIFSIEATQVLLPGEILLVSCFISYAGCFTRPYRIELMQNLWLPYFKNMDVSFSKFLKILS